MPPELVAVALKDELLVPLVIKLLIPKVLINDAEDPFEAKSAVIFTVSPPVTATVVAIESLATADESVAAKAVAFKEILDPSWKVYAQQVKTNAAVLADILMKRGYQVVSGGTDNHLVLVSFLDKDFSGKDADAALQNAGITVNKNTVPGETRSPFVTSGIRIGSPALTARGMGSKEFEIIANKISDVLDDISNEDLQKNVKEELQTLAQNFVIYTQGTY